MSLTPAPFASHGSDLPCTSRYSSEPASGKVVMEAASTYLGSRHGPNSSSRLGVIVSEEDPSSAGLGVKEILGNNKGPIRKSTFGNEMGPNDSSITKDEFDFVRRKASMPPTVRAKLGKVTEYNSYKLLMALVIIFNMIIGVIETDDRAADREARLWTLICSFAMLVVYALDILFRVIAFGQTFFRSFANLFDFTVVFLDGSVTLISVVFGSAGAGPTTSMVVSFLRGLRILRTFRVVRNFFAFRELYVMMQGFACAVRTLVFGLVLVFVVLTSWSILAVEVLNPINKTLTERGEYIYCERCQRAFQTVMTSNLTFMKSILAGDGWGEVSVPLMEHSPLATVILVSVFVSLQWGLMNIMTAVIVDSQASSRARDDRLMAAVKQEELEESYQKLLHLFVKMDNDGNGSLNCVELLKSYKQNAEFRELLNLMDISSEDLPMLFDILDIDGSGEVSYQEFVKQLHTIKNFDSHTLLIFIKHLVATNNDQMLQRFEKMTRAVNEISDCLHGNGFTARQSNLSRTDSSAGEYTWPSSVRSAAVLQQSSLSQASLCAGNVPCTSEPPSSSPYWKEKAEQKLDERMQLLQVAAVGSPSNAQVSQSLPSPTLDTHALMTAWESRLHQDLADIVAYASKRVALSGHWLQCNAGAAPSGMLQDATALPANRNVQRNAEEATWKTGMLDKAATLRTARPGVDKDLTEQTLEGSTSDVQGVPAHESHFRPKSRTPKDVSVAPVFPKRRPRPKPLM